MKVAVPSFEFSILNSRKCNAFIIQHDCNSHQRDNERDALKLLYWTTPRKGCGHAVNSVSLFCSVEVTWVNKTK